MKVIWSVYFFILIFIIENISLTSTSGLGKCPKYELRHNFDMSRFSGQWFEIERSFYLLELVSRCTNINLSLNPKGNYNVKASTINRLTSKQLSSYGIAIPMFGNSTVFRYKINTNLPFSISRYLPGAGIYNVLYTDYDNFAILWTCTNYVLAYTDRIWIFGRTMYISEQSRIDIYKKIEQMELDPERLMISKNENCIF